jgi:hypothetical protein
MSDITDCKEPELASSVDDLGEDAPLNIKEILEGEYLPAKPKKAGRPVGSTKDQAFSKRGSPKHEPNDVQRNTVMMHTLLGTPKQQIAKLIGISLPTLKKKYKEELEMGQSKANATVAGKLYNKAVNSNDTTAQIFWLKTQAGWNEQQNIKWEADPNASTPVNKVQIEVIGDAKKKED